MHFMVSAWGGRNWGFGNFDYTDHRDCVVCERPRLKQRHEAQPGCSVLWRTYVRASGGRHADAWRTRWSAAQRLQRGLRQWPRLERMSVAIAVAEALPPLRSVACMARDERSRTVDGQGEPRALGTFRWTTSRKCWPPSAPTHRCLRCGRRTRVWSTSWSRSLRPCRRVCRGWSEEPVEAPK